MTRTAVVICPGRGTYNQTELGYLARHHADKPDLTAAFDQADAQAGRQPVSAWDAAPKYLRAKHGRGDVASPLIYACALADRRSLAEDIDVVAVTGNSMGWYISLAAGGAVSAVDGYRIVTQMGTLMQDHGPGGQVIYPCVGEDWRPDFTLRAQVTDTLAQIAARPGHTLALSIDLSGILVLAGDEAGLGAFVAAVPPLQDRYPMRLPGHAAFHTALMEEVARMGRAALAPDLFGQPAQPLIDGRGAVWWPGATDAQALWSYTLDHQVTRAYDFAAAIRTAAREFAPDLFIVTGPGTTMGGAVAQSLIACGWDGIVSRDAFRTRQETAPLVISMGREDQRCIVT